MKKKSFTIVLVKEADVFTFGGDAQWELDKHN